MPTRRTCSRSRFNKQIQASNLLRNLLAQDSPSSVNIHAGQQTTIGEEICKTNCRVFDGSCTARPSRRIPCHHFFQFCNGNLFVLDESTSRNSRLLCLSPFREDFHPMSFFRTGYCPSPAPSSGWLLLPVQLFQLLRKVRKGMAELTDDSIHHGHTSTLRTGRAESVEIVPESVLVWSVLL